MIFFLIAQNNESKIFNDLNSQNVLIYIYTSLLQLTHSKFLLVKSQKEAEEHAAPPQPPPHEEFPHYHRPVRPYMNGYVSLVDQLSRILRLNDIELTHSSSLRMNFMDDVDDHYYSGYGPTPVPHEEHPYPPPGYPEPGHGEPAPRAVPRGLPPPPLGPLQPRYMTRGPPRPRPRPPPLPLPLPTPYHGLPPHWPERQAAPPPVGYPPPNYFIDENPNGCIVM